MDLLSDAQLYRRGAETLAAAWQEDARGASDAAVHRLPGVVVAVFPDGPERLFFNNSFLERGLTAAEGADALAAIEDAYRAAGVTHFAAWLHESDHELRDVVEARGYTLAESTRAMAITLDDLVSPVRDPELELAPAAWSDYLRFLDAYEGVPPGLLAGTDPTAFHVLLARADGRTVAAALAIDVGDDCGIYNVATVEHARGRGFGTALTALHLRQARRRGRRTASLQSTEMAERVYTRVGFRDLGRILEYAPASDARSG